MRNWALISNVSFRVQLDIFSIYNTYRVRKTVYNYIAECTYFVQKVTFHTS